MRLRVRLREGGSVCRCKVTQLTWDDLRHIPRPRQTAWEARLTRVRPSTSKVSAYKAKGVTTVDHSSFFHRRDTGISARNSKDCKKTITSV